MTAPETVLTMVDGRDALAFVILRPGSEGKVAAEAVAKGVSQKEAAYYLRAIANMWDPDDSRLVTVCGVCLQASCWQGIFLCQDAKGAGTVDLPVMALRALDREHSDYWKADQ